MNNHIEVIAEVGSNWGGNISTAIEMIKQAKSANADAVKFQLYDPKKRPDIDSHPYKDVLLASKITNRQLYILKDEADRNDIEFMASAFDLDRVKWLQEIGVKRFKIASKSIYDTDLCEAIQNTGKPYFVSMGLLNSGITDKALIKYGIDTKGEKLIDTWERLGYKNNKNASFLYCNFSYPTKLEDVDMAVDTFDYYDGFSDHTIGITASVVAMAYGARIIEKHFKLETSVPTSDSELSITPDELKQLCKMRNDIEQMRIYDGLYISER